MRKQALLESFNPVTYLEKTQQSDCEHYVEKSGWKMISVSPCGSVRKLCE